MREIWGRYLALQKRVGVKVHELQSKKHSVVDVTVISKSDMKDLLQKILTGSFRSVAPGNPLHINLVPKMTAFSLCKRSASVIMQQQLTDRRLSRAKLENTMKMWEYTGECHKASNSKEKCKKQLHVLLCKW